MKRPALLLLAATACLDPLYEHPPVVVEYWAACCAQGRVSTCRCSSAEACDWPSRMTSCAHGTCVESPRAACWSAGGGDAGILVDAGTTGDGGAAADGGWWGSDAGADGGWVDAGSGEDAGANSDAGSGELQWDLCCVGNQVTTCLCRGPCDAAWRACSDGRCVSGSESCR